MAADFSTLYRKLLAEHRPQYTPAEEKKLIERAQNGDSAARQRILETCYKLLLRLASKIVQDPGTSDSQDSHDALLSTGYESLHKTIDKYDTRNETQARFSTYAYRHIYGAMLRCRHNEKNSLVAVPYKYRPLLKNDLYEADFSDLSPEIAVALENACRPICYGPVDVNMPGKSETSQPEQESLEELSRITLCDYLYQLPPDQQFILGHIFGACGFGLLPASEIADLYGFSTANVSALKTDGLRQIAKLAGSELDDLF